MFDRFAAEQHQFPGVRMFDETAPSGGRSVRFQFPGAPATRPVIAGLSELGPRKQAMREEGIDHALLSLWTDLEGYELPPAEGLAWSRFINRCLKDTLAAEPCFTPLASVPLQDGALAAQVLEEALGQGFAGVMIGTLPNGAGGGNLDGAALEPFWSAASRLGAAVYLHPMFLCNEPRLADYDLINTVGRLADTTIAVGRLLSSGVLQRYPGLRLVLSHGGAALPLALGRFRRTYEAAGRKYADPDDGFGRLFFDSCVYDAEALSFLIGRAGAERVMLGSDAPMSIAEPHPVRLVDSVPLRAHEREAILGGTARKVFRLRSDCGCGGH